MNECNAAMHQTIFAHMEASLSLLLFYFAPIHSSSTGKGRFLIMGINQTPHFTPDQHESLRTGGSLKDGWSYVMPDDDFILDVEVSVAFSDELEGHVREQTEALKSLYLSSQETEKLNADSNLFVEEEDKDKRGRQKHFIVKRGLQVVGVATYCEESGKLTDVAVRPSAGKEVSETLFNAVKEHSRKMGRSGSLLVMPRSTDSMELFESMGFLEIDEENKGTPAMEYKHE